MANELLNADFSWANDAANLIQAIDGPTNTSALNSARYVATKYLNQKLDEVGSIMKSYMGRLEVRH
ncbi:hypothetical protein AB1K83_07775 [Sporosarcina sp. 179-K 3D1 HS]|uniref:hypothetical protein n=1 Tax=Sporosarcina sp. 179-K 3D1 HS TaxID=3232169 RepID=UPI0039A3EF0D